MVFRLLPHLLIVCLAWPLAGCSSTDSQPPDGGAAGGSGGSGAAGGTGGTGGTDGGTTCSNQPDLTAAAPTCNRAINSARAVAFVARTGTPPAPTGGVIADGIYVSTAAEGYGAITPAGRRITLVVLGGATKMLWTGEVLDAAASTVALAFAANTRISSSGNQLAFTVDCASTSPSPIPAALSYTATPGQLVLSLTTGANTAVTTYTRTGCP